MLSNTSFVKKSIVRTFSDFKDCLLEGIRYMISERLPITLRIVGRSHCSWVRDGVGDGGPLSRITTVLLHHNAQLLILKLITSLNKKSLGFNVPCAYPITQGILAVEFFSNLRILQTTCKVFFLGQGLTPLYCIIQPTQILY